MNPRKFTRKVDRRKDTLEFSRADFSTLQTKSIDGQKRLLIGCSASSDLIERTPPPRGRVPIYYVSWPRTRRKRTSPEEPPPKLINFGGGSSGGVRFLWVFYLETTQQINPPGGGALSIRLGWVFETQEAWRKKEWTNINAHHLLSQVIKLGIYHPRKKGRKTRCTWRRSWTHGEQITRARVTGG